MTVPITAQNSTTGGGVFDSWHQVADSVGKVQNAHGGDLAAVSVELGINVVSAVLDTVAFAMDPFAKLIAAGLGWLIEHVSFLKWPLDQVAGNPAEVTKIANELHKIGESLRLTGTDLDSALQSTITHWQGSGYDSFKKSIDDRKGWIDANAKASDVAGYMVETTGALIGAVRSLLRDIITTILGDIIATMLIALALAPVTFGASVVAAVGEVVVTVSVQVAAMAAKLAKVVAYAGRTVARLAELAKLVKPRAGAGNAGHELNTLPSSATTGGGHTVSAPPNFSRPFTGNNRPNPNAQPAPGTGGTVPNFSRPFTGNNRPNPNTQPAPNTGGTVPNFSRPFTGDNRPNPNAQPAPNATPHPNPAPNPAPNPRPSPSSHLSSQDISMIKKHENWLKTKFGDGNAKMKWVDTWLKNNAPDYYPMLKALSDAKSSKNFVGWAGKDIVQVDRGLTDIQTQAEAAWQQEQQAHQQ